ncbi:MAG: hypothetical protein KatS3mg109_0040 [Pirellulaceae bacterium]|nr:MAG: hypothetical protein KatS3mg109_0040 [Pirellulaceae bacterium]
MISRMFAMLLCVCLCLSVCVESRAEVRSYRDAYYASLEQKKPLIVIISSDRCPWCVRQKLELRDADFAVVAEINLTEEPTYSRHFKASVVPTMYVYGVDRKLIGKVEGFRLKEGLRRMILARRVAE